MRKIIVLQFMTLDGVTQAPGGPGEDTSGGCTHGGWVAPHFDEALGEEMGRQMQAPFDLLLGRKTFDIFASYWPHHTEENPGPEFAAAIKYVATRGNPGSQWDKTVFLRGDAAREVKALKEGDGPPMQVHGSEDFLQTLFSHGLVDEMWLKAFPSRWAGTRNCSGAACRRKRSGWRTAPPRPRASSSRGMKRRGIWRSGRWNKLLPSLICSNDKARSLYENPLSSDNFVQGISFITDKKRLTPPPLLPQETASPLCAGYGAKYAESQTPTG